MKKNEILLLFFCFFLGLNTGHGQNFQISGGSRFAIALDDQGNVYTWGDNTCGQLGNGTRGGYSSIPTQVKFPVGTPPIVAVEGGNAQHALALDCNGNVWAWGNNLDGQLGNGTGGRTMAQVQASYSTYDTVHVQLTPTKVLSGRQGGGTYLSRIRTISSGASASFAIDEQGRLWSWGSNVTLHYSLGADDVRIGGMLGNNDGTMAFSNMPVMVTSTQGTLLFTQVDATDYACYGLDVNGAVWAWGNNANGQLGNGASWGNGATDVQFAPQRIKKGTYVYASVGANAFLDSIASISAGSIHGLFLDVKGYVWSVGAAYSGIGGFKGGGGGDAVYAAKVANGNSSSVTGDLNFLTDVDPRYTYLGTISCSQGGNAAIVTDPKTRETSLYTWGLNFAYPLNFEDGTTLGGQLGQGTCATTGMIGSDINNGGSGSLYTPGLVSNFSNGGTSDFSAPRHVMGVSDGGGNFYIITQDPATLTKQIWVTGANDVGQLGMPGPNACVPTLLHVPFQLADPCPQMDLAEDTLYVCGNFKDTLQVPGIAKSYVYTWKYYADPSSHIPSSTTTKRAASDNKANTLEITKPGKYSVMVSATACGCSNIEDSIYVVSAQNCTALDLETNLVVIVSAIHPNPFKDHFILEPKGAQKYVVWDANGLLIEEKNMFDQTSLHLGEAWPKGLYMIQLISPSQSRSYKVVKE